MIKQTLSKYAICLVLLCLCFTNGLMAQGEVRPKVGLVLSGGGAKGVAHIGVLKVLEEAEIPIDFISGTSMGAIIGGLYSIGYTAEELDSMVRTQDWMFLLTDQIARPYSSFNTKYEKEHFLVNVSLGADKKISAPSGIIKGQGILNKFTGLTTGYHQIESFDSLPIPFACVAGDLKSGKEIVIRKGNLPLAMRTSMAVPGVFEPVYRNDMVLVDGGIFNNFPVDVAKEMGADITIGVDLSTEAFVEPDYGNVVSIANRIAFLSGEEKYRKNKKDVDLYMNPGLKGYTSADFKQSAIDTMIAMGEKVAREHWDDIIALKKKLGDYTPLQKTAFRKKANQVYISSIRVEGLETLDEMSLYKMLKIDKDMTISAADAESVVWSLQGLGLFDRVSYLIVPDNGANENTLVISVHEKGKGNIGIGVHIDTEDIASVLLKAQGAIGKWKKHNVTATAKINKNAWLDLDYNFRINNMNKLGASYRIAYKDFILKIYGEDKEHLSYLNNHVEVYMKNDSHRRFNYKTGIQYDWFSNTSQWYSAYNDAFHQKMGNYFLSGYFDVEYDNFDDKELPTRGVNVRLISELYVGRIFDESRYMFFPFVFRIKGAYSISDKICVLPELFGRFVFGDKVPGYYSNFVGGECYDRYMFGQQSFYGIHYTEHVENKAIGIRIDLRFKLAEKHYLSCVGNYMLHAGQMDEILHGEDMWGMGIKYSYNSFWGPVSATIDYSDRVKKIGFYASIGYCF
ncbi:patatin-like phospholipase family protein [Bacteroides sp.]|uniref:patatin-like phospholipase family protein n=1 Tax=Bacteroides sp. TaxID=29523 RepID=UPI00258DB6DF|nr:patatin-like phospholipase family protein [Bacteroides sp.]